MVGITGHKKGLFWLFGDLDRPLFSAGTFEKLVQLLDREGRQTLLSYSPYLTNSKLGWDDVTGPDEILSLGDHLKRLCQFHIEDSQGPPVLAVPDLFLTDSMLVSELPVSARLRGGLEALFPDPDMNLLGSEPIEIKSLVAAGIRWREILEFSHLCQWLTDADLNGVARISTGGVEAWANSLVSLLLYRADIDIAQTPLFIERFGFGVPAITLEEAGERLGVTRERFRQLERKVKVLAKANSISPPYFLEEIGDFPSEFIDGNPNWDGRALFNLLVLSGVWNEAEHSHKEIKSSKQLAKARPEIVGLIRKSAGTMGFVNLAKLENDVTAVAGAPGIAATLLGDTFEVRASTSSWALISKGKQSQAETAILNQLVFGKSLTGGEIHEGVLRRARSRSAGWEVPPQDAFIDLLRALPTVRVSSSGFTLNAQVDQNFQGQQKWMVDRILSSDAHCVALEDLVLEGASHGFLPSTTSQYAQTLEYLRVKDNVVWIAAVPPSASQIEQTLSTADLFEVDTRFEFDSRIDGGGVTVLFRPGTVFIRSAQVSVPAELEMVFGVASRPLKCICGAAADTPIRVSKGTLKGVTWLRNHLLTQHPVHRYLSRDWIVKLELRPASALLLP